MHTLDNPMIWRTLIKGLYKQAEDHGREAVPILDHVVVALLRYADMRAWPLATKGRTRAVGLQARFVHGGHRLKLKWAHATRTIDLIEVLGQTEGPVLVHFGATDSGPAIHAKMQAALRAVARRAAA